MKCSRSLHCSTVQTNKQIAKRKSHPKRFWLDKNNHKALLEQIAQKINVKSLDDWYEKSYQDVVSQGGRVLLNNYYKNSLVVALESIYPENNWQRWRFKHVGLPRGFWDNEKNTVAYLKYLSEHLNITHQQDWSLLTKDYIERSAGGPLLKKYGTGILYYIHYAGGLTRLLQRFIPGYSPTLRSLSFQKSISRSVSKGQGRLLKVVSSIFPNEEVLCDYKHPKLITSTITQMELDVFVPAYNIAFEYQGEQHYSWHYLYGSNISRQLRDTEKRKLCSDNNITLIEIPFWWDREAETIRATIHQYRSDLVPHSTGVPVNLSKVPTQIQKLQDLSKTLIASSVVPGLSPWSAKRSPVGWWLVQVPKGNHCLWDGQQFILQNGSTLHLEGPEGILNSLLQQTLPPHHIEGVLFSNSQEDSDLFKASQSQIRIHHPESLTFFAVDLPPSDNEQTLGYEERITNLLAIQTPGDAPLPSLLQLPQPIQCETTDHFNLKKAESDVSSKQLWLFRPRAIYLQRPTTSFQVESNSTQNINSAVSTEEPTYVRSYAPYVATEGSSVGVVPKCRGCRKPFTDRKEIRIEARGMFIPGDQVPYRTKYTFCASLPCVEKALHSLERSSAVRLPAFDGKVGIPEELNTRVQGVEGIQWVVL